MTKSAAKNKISGTHRVKVQLAYDGTDYCGWQKQDRPQAYLSTDKPSIQSTFECALERIFKQPIKAVASGRTDAGVHATGQIVHFDCPINPQQMNIKMALKAHLPLGISAKRAWLVPPDFHANHSALAKTYEYILARGGTPPSLMARYCHWYPYRLDVAELNEMSAVLLGTHDFKCFQSRGTQLKSTVRTIYKAAWIDRGNGFWHFRITGSGFLKQMIRNIVGTQLLFSKDKKNQSHIKELMSSLDRTKAGFAAPPKGLLLRRVYYPRELDNRCLEL